MEASDAQNTAIDTPPRARVQRIAAYALIVQDQRILLCRLAAIEKYVGSWTLPGGGMEFGEHPEETALREIREETGLEVKLTGLVTVDSRVIEIEDATMQAVRIVYRAEVCGGALTNELEGSTDCCAWFTRKEAEALPLVALSRLGVSLAFES